MSKADGTTYTRNCAGCGVYFTTFRSNKTYCNRDCLLDTQRRLGVNKEYNKKRYKIRVKRLVQCLCCGEGFETTYYNQVFCSQDCQRHHQGKRDHHITAQRKHIRLNEENEVIMPLTTVATCNMCGEPFLSWDTKINKRCPECSEKIGKIYAGVDERFLKS